MPLAPNSLLGPYRIDAEIGSGGMGHVFRATDTRLGRSVAVKVLPANRWSDPDLRQRFEREARALSSLSHPNLCALYDVGELQQDGATVPYLVMEHLEGETLRARLADGPLPVRTALTWGAQLASGLAVAHGKGLIHRDLKPENVFVVNDGLLKILDFGIARDSNPTADPAPQLRTQTGIVMGTAAYMSPEQARGAVVGPQSDIFSLGILLYEMLTGRSPFEADTSIQTMNAILVQDPPEPSAVAPRIPELVDGIVLRCLEKDPTRRFASARDLAFALEGAARNVRTSAAHMVRRRVTSASRKFGGPARTAVLIAALITVVAAAIGSRQFLSQQAVEPARLTMLTYSGRDSSPAASPDGKFIAYVSSRDGARRVWIKQLADGAEVAITSGPDDSAPRFSPDGSTVLFTRVERGASGIFRVPVVGGEPRKMIEGAFDADWSPDGKQVAFIRNRSGAARLSTLCIARSDGGGIEELAASTQEEFVSPRWSPQGGSIAVTRRPRNAAAGSIMIVDAATRETAVLARPDVHGLLSGTAWTTEGDALLYIELDAIAAISLPQRRGTGALVLHNLDGNARVLLRSAHTAADTVDILSDGRMVLVEDFTRQNLQEVAITTEAGTSASAAPPRWLSRGLSLDRQPFYTSNGKSVVFSSDRSGNFDLWQIAVDSGALERLTDHPAVDWDPHPSRDGRNLYWSSNRSGHFEIWRSANDGTGPVQVSRDGVDAENPSLDAASKTMVYDSSNPAMDGLIQLPAAGGAPRILVRGETIHPELSPDGRYVVYSRPETGGSTAIDVVDITDATVTNVARHITGVSATRARWIGQSRTIAFRAAAPDGRVTLFAQEFDPGRDTASTRRPLLPGESGPQVETFAISPDGTRAVLGVIDDGSSLMLAEGIAGVQ